MEPRETLLMAERRARPEHTPEAEPVLVRSAGGEVLLVLDDGEALAFDAAELRSALAPASLRSAA